MLDLDARRIRKMCSSVEGRQKLLGIQKDKKLKASQQSRQPDLTARPGSRRFSP